MAWAALDDGFHSNRKMLSIELDGMGLFAAALSYCADQETDGFVPLRWAKGIASESPRLLNRLSRRRAWAPVDVGDEVQLKDRNGNEIELVIDEKGFVILDYLEYNFSTVEIETRRQSKSRAGRKGAIKRWQGDSTSHSTSHNSRHSTCDSRTMATRAGDPCTTKEKELPKNSNGSVDLPSTLKGEGESAYALVLLLAAVKGTDAVKAQLRSKVEAMELAPYALHSARDELVKARANGTKIRSEAAYVFAILERYVDEREPSLKEPKV
jgi:hypothetical protein